MCEISDDISPGQNYGFNSVIDYFEFQKMIPLDTTAYAMIIWSKVIPKCLAALPFSVEVKKLLMRSFFFFLYSAIAKQWVPFQWSTLYFYNCIPTLKWHCCL